MSTFFAVARRPRWIGVLLLALAVAGGFAALGQWQLERSFVGGAPEEDTETVVPLTAIAEPQQPIADAYRLVETPTVFVPDDYVVLQGRLDAEGEGSWVVGHAVLPDGASLAVALGWTPDADAALAAVEQLRDDAPSSVTGRYLPSEAPIESDFEAGERSALAVSELVNLWSQPPDGVYAGYLIAGAAPAGLAPIDAPPPSTEVSLNLLNLFYAVEWVIFGGFAVYLWYRLVRDVVEAEAEASPESAET